MLANRLSADGTRRVLLLEAGPRDNYLWIHIPIGYGKTMFHPVYNWGFHTDPEPGTNNRRIYWPRGRGLGGSSSINGLIFVRGQHADYDAWAARGNQGWGWKDVLPYFLPSEDHSPGASETPRPGGPVAWPRTRRAPPPTHAARRESGPPGARAPWRSTDESRGSDRRSIGRVARKQSAREDSIPSTRLTPAAAQPPHTPRDGGVRRGCPDPA